MPSSYASGFKEVKLMFVLFMFSGLTTWLCVAPRIAVAACIPVCLVPGAIYMLLDKEPLKDHLQKNKTDHEDVQYTSLKESSKEHTALSPTKPMHELVFIFKVCPLITYCFASNFCLHLTMTSILTTLTFPSSPFRPRDHLQYYRLLSDAGILFGGMGSLLVSCLCHKWIEFFRIRKIWILVLLNVSHVMLFVLASWLHFVPNVIMILVLCFTQGFAYGSTVVHCVTSAVNLFSCARYKGTALGLTEVAKSVGRSTAGLLGLFTERYLREHCTYRLMLGQFCLARHSSQAGWNTSLNCKI
jgi:hypothetical protein